MKNKSLHIFSLKFLLILLLGFSFQQVSAQSFACSDALYFTSSANTNVYRYTPSTNSLVQVAGVSINYGSSTSGSAGAGISPGGTRLYFNDRISPRQLRYNTGNTTNTIAAAQADNSNNAQRNAIDSSGNGFYSLGQSGSPNTYYRYTTGGATSTITGPFTFTLQPSTAPAIGIGGDIAFDGNDVGYLVDQNRNLYRLDVTANTATYLGGLTGMGTSSPNGLGFSGTSLYVSTLDNTIYQVNLATLAATLRTPTSTPSGFSQNDIATCTYPTTLIPNIAATKAYRNVTKGDPTNFSVSSSASPGDTLEYRVIVRNSGNISSGNTTFQDTIPSGVTYVANSTTLNSSAVTDLAGTGNARFNYQTAKNINGPSQGTGVIRPDTTPATITDNEAVVIFRVTVNNPFDGTANPVPNTAQVNYSGASSVINSNTVNTTVNIPDLTLTKSDTGNFTVGSSGTYSFTVTNSGTAASSGTITVTDTLPTGLTVNGGAAGGITEGGTNAANWTCNSNAASPQVITCTSSTAISNTSGSNTSVFNFAVNVGLGTAVGTNSITNTASVSGGSESNTGNNSASDPTTVLSPDLTIAKSHTGNFTRGSTGTYTITVSNSGTAATSGTITVTDTLPTGLSVNGGAVGSVTAGGTNAANWICNSNSATPQVITCTSTTSIAVSGTSVFTLTVNVASNAAGSVTNSVAVSGGNEATANNGNNSATDPTTTVGGVPNISLDKSCPSPANCESVAQLPGTDITYRIDFTNTGGASAANLKIIDAIPSDMDYKIGSAAVTSGISFTIEFSDNYDPLNPTLATWIYTPVSQGGGAPVGYDRLVKAIRWSANAAIPNTSPNNTGYVNFIAKIR